MSRQEPQEGRARDHHWSSPRRQQACAGKKGCLCLRKGKEVGEPRSQALPHEIGGGGGGVSASEENRVGGSEMSWSPQETLRAKAILRGKARSRVPSPRPDQSLEGPQVTREAEGWGMHGVGRSHKAARTGQDSRVRPGRPRKAQTPSEHGRTSTRKQHLLPGTLTLTPSLLALPGSCNPPHDRHPSSV